ncbi:MAG: hypothetical protein IPP48_11480 [Chitinophagaceae bacterium]|nr:hypothetical protein [Chitinophagaceae bacterium]
MLLIDTKLKNITYVGALPVKGFLFKDDLNCLWLGALKNLYKFNQADKDFHEFKVGNNIFSNGVTCIRQLPNNIFTIGIRFSGVALMKDTSVIATITEKEGLLDNSIKYLLPDGNRLWVATPKGISAITFTSYNPIAYNIKNFGDNAGLGNQIIYQLIKFKGNVLAATSKGIYEITDVEKLLQEKPIPIPLYITNINSYKGDTSGISSITVPYNYSRVTVKFNAICFNTPKRYNTFIV